MKRRLNLNLGTWSYHIRTVAFGRMIAGLVCATMLGKIHFRDQGQFSLKELT